MYIAQSKRKENIAEYILYLWQLEDLLRALQFSPEAIWTQLVAPQEKDETRRHELLVWYIELAGTLCEEGKAEHGHLNHTLRLISELQALHEQLPATPAGESYRPLFARLAPHLPRLREALGKPETGDIELCFRALYAVMLYRMQGKDAQRNETVARDVLETVSPVIAELARFYGMVERGETDLFEAP